MKFLALTVLVVALAAVQASAQSNGRKGSSTPAPSPAAGTDEAIITILEPEKPFVPPCGLKQKLEANCAAGKTESTKEVTYCTTFETAS